jgi:hypothetical protein
MARCVELSRLEERRRLVGQNTVGRLKPCHCDIIEPLCCSQRITDSLLVAGSNVKNCVG